MTGRRRIVVKFGTKLLCRGGERLDSAIMTDLVRQVATLQAQGWQVTVVTSGAVAAGRASRARADVHRGIRADRVR